jgi:hypothetical protein
MGQTPARPGAVFRLRAEPRARGCTQTGGPTAAHPAAAGASPHSGRRLLLVARAAWCAARCGAARRGTVRRGTARTARPTCAWFCGA